MIECGRAPKWRCQLERPVKFQSNNTVTAEECDKIQFLHRLFRGYVHNLARARRKK
jgi:hypothetical protein